MKKIIAAVGAALALAGGLSACSSDADVASQNLSKDADNFKIVRRVVLYNGITNDYTLAVVGKCSLGNSDSAREASVTCKMDDGKFVKHIFRLGDNMTVFAEQLETADASTQHYKVVFKPSTVIPDLESR